MIEALFFDIDGTLLSFDTHTIPESTLSALRAASEKGVRLFVATGRSKADTACVRQIDFDGYITANGGYCFTSDSIVVHKSSFTRRSLDTLLGMLRTESFSVAMLTAEKWYCNSASDRVRALSEMVELPVPTETDLEVLCEKEEIFGMCLYADEEMERRIVANMGGCSSSRWNDISADITPAGTDKAVGIDKMLAHYGLDRNQAMAFGDGGNDIPMLRHVATGVAMGSASEQVRQAADYVTGDVDLNGIYDALKHFNII